MLSVILHHMGNHIAQPNRILDTLDTLYRAEQF
jgi:hypothetical protein